MPCEAVPLGGEKPAGERYHTRSRTTCLSCHELKPKCDTTKGSPVCNACTRMGKSCIFRPYENTQRRPLAQSRTPFHTSRNSDGSSEKKRFRDISKRTKGTYTNEALSVLTKLNWEQVLQLYKLYFEKLSHRLECPRKFYSSDFNLVLLRIFTLTARFHPGLPKDVASMSEQPESPTAASEHYADVLGMTLGPLQVAWKTASVERVQAALMLGV